MRLSYRSFVFHLWLEGRAHKYRNTSDIMFSQAYHTGTCMYAQSHTRNVNNKKNIYINVHIQRSILSVLLLLLHTTVSPLSSICHTGWISAMPGWLHSVDVIPLHAFSRQNRASLVLLEVVPPAGSLCFHRPHPGDSCSDLPRTLLRSWTISCPLRPTLQRCRCKLQWSPSSTTASPSLLVCLQALSNLQPMRSPVSTGSSWLLYSHPIQNTGDDLIDKPRARYSPTCR